MRILTRDKKLIHFAKYLGKVEKTETIGGETVRLGEYEMSYGEVQDAWVYVSIPVATALSTHGNAEIGQYGVYTEYRRNVVSETDLGLDVADVLWIEKEPYDDKDNLTEPDYRVRRIDHSFHHHRYEVKEY